MRAGLSDIDQKLWQKSTSHSLVISDICFALSSTFPKYFLALKIPDASFVMRLVFEKTFPWQAKAWFMTVRGLIIEEAYWKARHL